ncbi:MAG: RHS repeat-associated core domain-containing protein [Anaerolineales bacterium]|nr:RHS repeat-associated core domain-containing protein [Anaerolineales bacterium]
MSDRVEQSVDGVTTRYVLDSVSPLTQVLQDGSNSYLYGMERISQVQAGNPEYFLTDGLGSVRQLVDEVGSVSLSMSYQPYGETLNSSGDSSSSYGFSGEWTDQSGLEYLRARYYNLASGGFITKDVWDGDFNTPMSYNEWLYVLANPINYTDPTGFYLCENFDCDGDDDFKWQGELKKQDKLFSLVFRGSGINGTWTKSDWEYYCKNRNSLFFSPQQWKIKPDSEIGWDLFALHSGRLASHYSLNEKTKFVRDFALLFAGISSKGHWLPQAISSYKGPAVRMSNPKSDRSFVYYKNTGLASEYLDVDVAQNQSHHYAGLFYLGYFAGPEIGWLAGVVREIGDKNPGDALLGDQAALDAYYFRYYSGDLKNISNYITRLSE